METEAIYIEGEMDDSIIKVENEILDLEAGNWKEGESVVDKAEGEGGLIMDVTEEDGTPSSNIFSYPTPPLNPWSLPPPLSHSTLPTYTNGASSPPIPPPSSPSSPSVPSLSSPTVSTKYKYYCPHCKEVGFTTRDSYMYHMQSHSASGMKKSRFICSICKSVFYNKAVAVRHVRLSHNKVRSLSYEFVLKVNGASKDAPDDEKKEEELRTSQRSSENNLEEREDEDSVVFVDCSSFNTLRSKPSINLRVKKKKSCSFILDLNSIELSESDGEDSDTLLQKFDEFMNGGMSTWKKYAECGGE